jgi:hypothetical protein
MTGPETDGAGAPDPAERRRRWRGRIVLGVLALGAVVMLALPNLITWWHSGELCPSTLMKEGRTARGIDWRVTRSDCGETVGVVWQVRVVAPGGVSQPIYDARGWPEVEGVDEADEGVLAIRLARSPDDGSAPEVRVHVDHKGRPADPARFLAGHRLN